MRSGTPGFVGDRLREAREVRGLTAVALSELTDILPQSISQYERSKATPSPEAMEAIAKATRFPINFFTLPEREYDRGPLFYRSMAAATKGARSRAERRLTWTRDLFHFLSGVVEFAQPNIPDLRVPDDPLLLSDSDIDLAADNLRRFWGMDNDPIANAVLLLENHGAIVVRDKLGAEALDGLSESDPSNGRPYVMIGTDKGTAVRWRFDATHELGHIVLHSKVDRARLRKPADFKRIEEQANRFAASFLLPLESFGDELTGLSLDAMLALKPRWKVSVAMMIMRCRDAGFLADDDKQRRFWINYSRRGWRKGEPYDDSLQPEIPSALRSALEMATSADAMLGQRMMAQIALPESDIETMLGLPNAFFSSAAPHMKIRHISPEASDEDERLPSPSLRSAQVIELPFRQR